MATGRQSAHHTAEERLGMATGRTCSSAKQAACLRARCGVHAGRGPGDPRSPPLSSTSMWKQHKQVHTQPSQTDTSDHLPACSCVECVGLQPTMLPRRPHTHRDAGSCSGAALPSCRASTIGEPDASRPRRALDDDGPARRRRVDDDDDDRRRAGRAAAGVARREVCSDSHAAEHARADGDRGRAAPPLPLQQRAAPAAATAQLGVLRADHLAGRVGEREGHGALYARMAHIRPLPMGRAAMHGRLLFKPWTGAQKCIAHVRAYALTPVPAQLLAASACSTACSAGR